jgi:hypothetical protein
VSAKNEASGAVQEFGKRVEKNLATVPLGAEGCG